MKLKQRNLRASHTLGWSCEELRDRYTGPVENYYFCENQHVPLGYYVPNIS
jgi:hypothetical protein